MSCWHPPEWPSLSTHTRRPLQRARTGARCRHRQLRLRRRHNLPGNRQWPSSRPHRSSRYHHERRKGRWQWNMPTYKRRLQRKDCKGRHVAAGRCRAHLAGPAGLVRMPSPLDNPRCNPSSKPFRLASRRNSRSRNRSYLHSRKGTHRGRHKLLLREEVPPLRPSVSRCQFQCRPAAHRTRP